MKFAEVSNQTNRVNHRGIRIPSRPWHMAILAILLLTFIVISVLAHKYTRFPGDLTFTLLIQSFDSGFVKKFMEVISQIGGGQVATAVLLGSAVLFWVKHKRQESLLLIGAGILSSVDRLVKILADRPRPSPDLVIVTKINDSGSFPSGHATFAMVLFGALFYFSGVYISNAVLKRLAQAFAVAIILLTGVSRIYLGAHWPSDVLGGYLLGSIIVGLLVVFHKRSRSVADQQTK